MRLKIALVLIALALGAALLTGKREAQLSAIVSDDKQPAAAGPKVPVLVELFTSEGCSSCPPADELLTRLEQTQPVAGADVIALSEHVDYWNRLGWTDPYSSAEFSSRQNDYAGAFETDEVYTPQMIVDGRVQFVGSNSSKAREAIADAARDSKANVTMSLALEDKSVPSMTLSVRVDTLPESRLGNSAAVLLAITESGLRSNVSRGENAGRHLIHSAVVRKLSRLGSIVERTGEVFSAQPVVQIEKSWRRENLRAVVFVQDQTTRRVLGVGAFSIGK